MTVEHLHDLGKLLFAFTAFWAYIAFSQYFLIWYANIPEETVCFIGRSQGSWATVGRCSSSATSRALLLPHAARRQADAAAPGAAALWLLAMHFVDIYWCVMPTLSEHGLSLGVLDATTLLAVGGCFLAAFGWMSSRGRWCRLGDPRLPESLSFENV